VARATRFPFTTSDVKTSRQELAERFPDATPEFVDYGVASEVVINVFGPAWYERRLVGSRADPHFRAGDAENPYIHQARVIQLGNDLLVCQHLGGFAELRDELAARSVHAVAHEVRVARMLHQSGHHVQFVVPQGRRGADFDLLVDGVLATEVKARDDAGTYSFASLRSALASDARSQLPADGPGLIVLRIPDAWGRDPRFAAESDRLFAEVLRSTRRVNGILLLWDEWLQGESGGAARLTRFAVHENDQPRTDFPDLPRVLRSLAFDGSLGNESILFLPGSWTIACSARRHGGPGPLLESFDGGLQVGIDRGGAFAVRVGGLLHVADISMDAINGRWIHLVLRSGPSGVDLRVDGHAVEDWVAPSLPHRGLRTCPSLDADIREQLVYSERVSTEGAEQLIQYLSSRCHGPYVSFRRGDAARFRTGDEN
jgi:hypothetical protein